MPAESSRSSGASTPPWCDGNTRAFGAHSEPTQCESEASVEAIRGRGRFEALVPSA